MVWRSAARVRLVALSGGAITDCVPRMIDDEVAVAVGEGGHGQCVLLGAGFDTRAHRLQALAGCRVFEVDHPATQAVKRAVVDRLGLARRDVTYVPVDFAVDDLVGALRGAGFDGADRAVFVWEGVTNYLTAESVGETLASIRALTAAGSCLVLTYVDRRALVEPSPFPEARRWVKGVARAGEPWTFGLLPDEATGFFAERGFRVRADVSTFDAGRAWFTGQARREEGSRLYRIAVTEPVGSAGPG
jgi:methyltransferase (TIGR00027 family)